MDDFDKQLNNIMEQTLFGGSPYERVHGRKKHITFEAAEDTVGPDFQDVDLSSMSDRALEFINVIKSVNSETPHKPGAMIKNASTDTDSVIRKTFMRLFKDKLVYFFPDAANPGVASETPEIMWIAPERHEGQQDMYDEDGMMIVAHYTVPGNLEIEPMVDKKQYRYVVRHGDQQVEYPAEVEVGKLMGEVTIEVYVRRTDNSSRPIVTFYEDSVRL